MSANPWVRPYVLTRGRTRTRNPLHVHTLVMVDRYDGAGARRLAPEARRLYERAALAPASVAELSAHCGVSLGVTRVLLEDLASAGRVRIHAGEYSSPFDRRLLERVIDGLREYA